MSRDRKQSTNIGTASIVLIFVVLCLTVFATLSYTTAFRENVLSQKNAAAMVDYYEADWKAESLYETIDQLLQTGQDENKIADSLDEVEWNRENGGCFEYTIIVDERQQLRVQLHPCEDKTLQVWMWKVEPIGEWGYSHDIKVWDGE